ncbi:MAG: radical SAM protein [Clostridia bacterium]|nr:radical SAM protein [Clostridia bacterium]
MKKVEIILKVTDACNLRCKYCYNGEREYEKNCLSLEHFEKLLNVLLTGYNLIHIIWHGGEPLSVGLDYFKKAMDVEKRVQIQSGVTIENSVQTNGTLINSAWIKFFKEHSFRVGISFDGVENEKYRGCTEKTLAAMEKLRANGIKFGCNAVVADNDYDIIKNYEFFASKGISFDFSRMIQEGGAKNMVSVGTESFVKSMCDLFDHWVYDTDGVSVRTFVMYLNLLTGGRYRICSNCSCHLKYLSISPKGTVYNCSRESMGAYPFGSIESFETTDDIFNSEGAIKLLSGSIERRNKCKAACEYFELCAGGCADVAIVENGLENIPTEYCYTFKTLYSHIKGVYEEIVNKGTPLSDLNPTVREIMVRSISKTVSTTKNDIADTYI